MVWHNRGFSEQSRITLGNMISDVTTSFGAIEVPRRQNGNSTKCPHLAKNKLPMPEEMSEMSQATRDILLKVRKMVPPMLEKFHKGRTPPFDVCSYR